MSELAARLNSQIEAGSPALAAALSALGRRAAFPPDIPFQAAQARGKEFNATIGQVTDGAGKALALPSLAAGLSALDEVAQNRALLYSPLAGLPELRQRWAERQRGAVDPSVGPTTLPFVTTGLTHGLSLVADLFGGPGRKVAVPAPFWGNYRQSFALRTGAEMVSSPGVSEGAYRPTSLADALSGLPADEPAIAILNLPSNPGGYSPTEEERAVLGSSLLEVASERPLIVVCDDAYAGLVYEDEIPRASMFWQLVGAHPNLIPVKVDGATKELSYFGGRVGFLTFPFAQDSEIGQALENKLQSLLRATLGSPVSTSQVLVLEGLLSASVEDEVEEVHRVLAARYRTLKAALAQADPELVRPWPFNSGCFALLELPDGLVAEEVRRHLLDEHDTGLIAIGSNFLRIAYCSVAEDRLEKLVQRVETGLRELRAR